MDQKEKRKESHIALAVSRLHSRVLLSMESATETIGSRALLRCESWRTRRSLVCSGEPTVRNRGMCQCFDACAGPGARTLRFDGFQQLSGGQRSDACAGLGTCYRGALRKLPAAVGRGRSCYGGALRRLPAAASEAGAYREEQPRAADPAADRASGSPGDREHMAKRTSVVAPGPAEAGVARVVAGVGVVG